MGCDWVEGQSAVFGYCIDYHGVFPRGTVLGDLEEIYSDDVYAEYDDGPNPHAVLAKAWASHAVGDLAGISAMLGVVTRPGKYEATGYSIHSRVVFGVSLSEVFSRQACEDGSWHERLAGLCLPTSLPERISEFLKSFRQSLGALAETAVSPNLSAPSLVIFL